MFSGLIVVYLLVLILLYTLGKSLWRPLFWIFGIFFQGAVGALGIYLFNLLGRYILLQLPLNPFNSLFVGFLGLPGLITLLIAKYLLKI